ncbi:MAG: DUF4870 domain-containing protein [Actinomycetota bacterium]|nr:DUF4870 domain-containing protein [Actinomycetota bacterium]
MDEPQPPAGWYADATSALRWWDGRQWGPAAPAVSVTQSGRTLALLSHLGQFAGNVLLPLIVRQTEGKRNEFVRHHATEALNFQITFMIVWLGIFALLFSTALLSPVRHSTRPPATVIIVFPFLFLLFFAAIGLSILGCVRASQERWWRYPVSLRLVRGARPRDADKG